MSTNKVWKSKSPPLSAETASWQASPLALQIAGQAGLTPLQEQILINRGLSDSESARSFLNPRLARMADPMLLKDMDCAISTIIKAFENQDKITIYGDYDADGLTAAALLLNFFSGLDIPVSYYIPNRLGEGYGLNKHAIEKIAANGTALIITVDCGASNSDEIALAKKLGMKVVVTDHHQIPEPFKPCCPVVNPHRPDCSFPFKDLAGVGVTFFLLVALRASLREMGWFKTRLEPDLREYLDMVALGTVADRVPLLDQNRILVSSGMEYMARSRWEGIKAMKEVAGITGATITSEDIAFKLAPRLNAPGRMGAPEKGIEILTVKKPRPAQVLAFDINAANQNRRKTEKSILDQIENTIKRPEEIKNLRTLFMAGENWHKGVLGIVASRLVNKYHRPSFVLTIQDGMAVGSGRSIDGFNLYEALSRISHLFEKMGGHTHAAGLTLKAKRLETFRNELEALAKETLNEKEIVNTIDVDAELSLQDIDLETISRIRAFAPFGEGNPEPLFLARSLEVTGSWIVGNTHLKLKVKQGKAIFDAIGFGLAEFHPLKGKMLDIVFTPTLNQWQGQEKIQLRVVDLALNSV